MLNLPSYNIHLSLPRIYITTPYKLFYLLLFMDTKNILGNLQNHALIKQTPLNETLAKLSDLHQQATNYITYSKSSATWKAYRSDWNHFNNWCQEHHFQALPSSPEVIVLYITSLASTHKTSTIQRRLASVAQMHTGNNFDDPTKTTLVKETWKGIRRSKGIGQVGKNPLLVEELKKILFALPNTPKAIRDKSLLLVGLCCGFRRSELVSLNVEDIRFVREGMIITLRKSKTDQESMGRELAIPYAAKNPYLCPIKSLKDWLTLSKIRTGAIFRTINRHGQILDGRLTSQSVALLVKQYVGHLGLDSKLFSGHSLRAGLVTSLALAGLSESAIMRQSGHRSSAVLKKYIRHANLFQDHPLDKLGL